MMEADYTNFDGTVIRPGGFTFREAEPIIQMPLIIYYIMTGVWAVFMFIQVDPNTCRSIMWLLGELIFSLFSIVVYGIVAFKIYRGTTAEQYTGYMRFSRFSILLAEFVIWCCSIYQFFVNTCGDWIQTAIVTFLILHGICLGISALVTIVIVLNQR